MMHAPLRSPDDVAFVTKVEKALAAAERDQASAALRFIEVGRMLLERKEAGKRDGSIPHGQWVSWLERTFPQRSVTRLQQFMQVAETIDSSKEAKTKSTLFLGDGFDAVLNEVRKLKRPSRPKPKPAPLVDDVTGELLRILVGDCRARLRELSDDSVDAVITSPPYYRQRIYDGPALIWDGSDSCAHDWEMHADKLRQPTTNPAVRYSRHQHKADAEFEWGTCRKCGAWLGQLGLEPTRELYVDHVLQIFREVRRVLQPTGTLWIIVADGYNDGRLQWMPHRLAVALDADGWIGRNEIIWRKGEGACENVTNRCARNHEQVLLFVKDRDYWFDADAIKEPAKHADDPRAGRRIVYSGKNQGAPGTGQRAFVSISDFRIKRTVWTVNRQPTRFDHFAVMPEKLIEPMALAGCAEGGTILDPFAGAGTAGLVANALGRRAILIEASPEYAAIAKERIEQELPRYAAELARAAEAPAQDAGGESNVVRLDLARKVARVWDSPEQAYAIKDATFRGWDWRRQGAG
jgi:DNA modification methylase